VAYIRFKTQQAAQTSVSFAQLILADDDTNAIPYTALDLDLEVTGAGNVYLPIVIKS
jgi:hypothetical protein